MLSRPFGATGLTVSILGYGAMQIGAPQIAEPHAARLLNHVLDRGVTLIDTARSYGLAEERIGRHLAARRSEYLLSTKVGYGVDGVPDWTADCVLQGVEAACRRMRTEWIDVVHLHSCGRNTLESNGVLEALVRCREAGLARCVAYSGENEALEYALSTGSLDAIQLSVNVCDQRSLDWLDGPRSEAWGVLAKRPFAERPWSRADAPDDPPAAEYWRRFRTMFGDEPGGDWQQRALRFAAFAPGVDCCIVGTTQIEHFDANLRIVDSGPLPEDEFAGLRARFAASTTAWPGVI